MPSFNHYGTVVDANLFFETRLFTFAWDRAAPLDKAKALQMASQLIDAFDYLGDKYAVAILGEDATEEQCRLAELSQAREFPRGTVNTVPEDIEHACYLIAKALLSGREPDMDLENLATKASSYGDVKTTYQRDGNMLEHITHLIPSPEAFNKIRPFLRERNVFEVKRT